jgi:sugar phosphate permease
MLKWLISIARRFGRYKMLAECIVAVGTMLIPLAIVLLTTVKNFPLGLAQSLIVAGVVALVVGLVLAIRNEVRESRKDKRIDDRENMRRRTDKANLIIMAHMAEKLGVDMNEVYKITKAQLEKTDDDEY